MSRQQVGHTWWGQRWLEGLAELDEGSRLARGVAYAQGGRVGEVQIRGGRVTATVSGHGGTSSHVKVRLPAMDREKVRALAGELAKYPVLVSKLMHRELSPEVMEIVQRLGIELFPKQWGKMGMTCDCSDHAVPCKHVAAVLYVLCQELETNPFLLFTLHGVDLLAELQAQSRVPLSNALPEPERVEELMQKESLPGASVSLQFPEKYHLFSFSCDTDLPSYSILLPSLLRPAPPFYANGDFRKVYQRHIAQLAYTAERMLDHPEELAKVFAAPSKIGQDTDVMLLLDRDVSVSVKTLVPEGKPPKLTCSELVGELLQLPLQALERYSCSVLALRLCAFCALQLLAHGAILPRIVRLDNEEVAILWRPALLDAKVSALVADLSEKVPSSLLVLLKDRKPTFFRHPAAWIVSLFLGDLIQTIATPETDVVTHLFFAQKKASFSGFGEAEIPGSIKAWTDRFHLEKSRFAPAIVVQETPTKGEFSVTFGLVDKEDAQSHIISLADLLSGSEFQEFRVSALQSLSELTHLVSGLDESISSQGQASLILRGEELVDFLLKTVPTVRLLSAHVILPRCLKEFVRPKAHVVVKQKRRKSAAKLKLKDILEFDWKVALGEDAISVDEFNQLAEKAKGLLYYKGRYIYLTPDDVAGIQKRMQMASHLTQAEMLKVALSREMEDARIALEPEVEELIRSFSADEEIPIPQGLHATLRPYQVRGYSWLYQNRRVGFGSILADDMGLGKTIQLITLLLKMKEEGDIPLRQVLIIAPTGLLTNWQAELERFAPSLTHRLYHGSGRSLEKSHDVDIFLTSYGVARTDYEILSEREWELVAIDEAQNIKNQDTAQSKAVRSIPAQTHIALSGTPVENRLSEFWSIMDFVNHGYLGSEAYFNRKFVGPIEHDSNAETAATFREITAPFMMRRLKSDKNIISDLPDKMEVNRYAMLTPEQASLYQAALKHAMESIESVNDSPTAMFERATLVLRMMLALKQICNHPAQYLKNKDRDPAHSGKVQLLLDLLESILENNEKALIFTQFRETGEILLDCIEKRLGILPMFYHGGCSIEQRNEYVHRFQNNPKDRLLILSLRAAGTGLNLTAASHVIHFDLWWNPAVESQATDRAYRIGQTKNVLVHRFITKNTFEERINTMIAEKKALADLTVSAGESWIGRLSNEELHAIFAS